MRRLMILALCLVSLVGLAGVAWAALTFCQSKESVNACSREVASFQSAYVQASATMTDMSTRLGNMATVYKATFTDVTAAAAADPTNVAWADLKASLDLIKTEYTALKLKVDTAKACFAAIEVKGTAKVQAALDGIQ